MARKATQLAALVSAGRVAVKVAFRLDNGSPNLDIDAHPIRCRGFETQVISIEIQVGLSQQGRDVGLNRRFCDAGLSGCQTPYYGIDSLRHGGGIVA